MNTTDLRDELTALAEAVTAPPTLADGVASKITATRRRRTGLAATGAGLAVAAIAVGVLTTTGQPAPTVPAGSPSSAAPMIGSDGMPFRAIPDAPGDVVKGGLRYRAHVADDTLSAGFIGDRGQAQFTLAWQPTTTHVSFGSECYLPGLTDEQARKYMVTVGLVGQKGFFGSQCSSRLPDERDLPAGGVVPGEPGQGWTELTVGQDANVRIQLVDAKTNLPASVDGALLTGAVYEQGAERTVTDPATGKVVAALPEAREHNGYTYRLQGRISIAALANGTSIVEATPASLPFLVTYGSAGSPEGDMGTDYLKGLAETSGQNSTGGQATVPQPARPAGTVEVIHEGSTPAKGIGLLAVYTLAN